MMLQALYDLARRERLVEDPDHETKRVDFFLRIDQSGRFLGLTPTEDDGRVLEIPVPRFPKRSGTGTTPGFLYDNAKYVLGLGGGEGAEGGRNEKCVEAFRALVDALARETRDEGACAVARFYERRAAQLRAIVAQHPEGAFSGSEWIAFKLDGDGERPVHDRPAVRAYWRARRSAEAAEGGAPVRCLVTGEVGPPARTHGNIKRVPQAQTSGAALVSFNAASFASHGLEQGENAPVSRAAAEGYVTALNWLLQGTPERRFKHGIALGDDSVILFWTREEHAIIDVFPDLLDPPPDPDQARRLAESPLAGLAPADIDGTAFYAVTLGGNAARVVVRDWLETTVRDLKQSLAAYFDALRIAGDDGRPLSIRALLASVESPGGRGLSPCLGARLFRAAVRGEPFPRELLGAALRRLRLPPDKLDERRMLRARCALVKATLTRPPLRGGAPMEVSVSLDDSSTQVPYLLGRLFAVLERLQGAALGDINTTIRDRYFGAASSTPALVFPRLIRLSMHHAAKAEGAGWLEQIKERIVAGLPAEPFPRTLTLEEQGLFAIGYYHQRQKLFEKRADKAAPEDATKAAS
ncbi:MAG: type I-C CRISPR-associated protein Cas8c/Csd1 [Minicystis sp.]